METNTVVVTTKAPAVVFQFESYLKMVGDWVFTHTGPIVLILVLTLVVLRIIGVLSARLAKFLGRKSKDAEYEKRAKTLGLVIQWILRVGVLVLALIMMLGELGVKVGPLLAAAGVVGLAIGFGAQNLVGDFITGFFLLLEDQIRVGDVVQIGDKGGLVEAMTLRMVILRDEAGNVHFIRNGKIDVVTNLTKDFSRYVFSIGVGYGEDVDQVITILKQIDEELRQDPEFKDAIIEPLEVMGLDHFGDSAIIIKARTTTRPIQQWRVGREFNRRLKRKFEEHEIEIPSPHRVIFFGRDREGKSTGVRVEGVGGGEKPEGEKGER